LDTRRAGTETGYDGGHEERRLPARSRGRVVRIDSETEFKLTVERSRFHAVLFPAGSEEDVAGMLKRKRGEHRKANHHCWGLRARDASGAVVERSKDDGEVGHPGRVLLELLRREDLEGGLLVSRVFGGVKLGVGGVSRAFRGAGEGAVAEYRRGRSAGR
jgi:putative IMPACT (imprinted ancient) family translation regulator